MAAVAHLASVGKAYSRIKGALIAYLPEAGTSKHANFALGHFGPCLGSGHGIKMRPRPISASMPIALDYALTVTLAKRAMTVDTLDRPQTKQSKLLGASHLQAFHTKARSIMVEKTDRFESKLEAIVRESLGKAAETLKIVAKAGPAIGHQLNSNLGKQLSPEQLDTSARTYERLVASSRSQLGLDSEQASKSSIQVSILSNIPSPHAQQQAIEVQATVEPD
jgi:hypothetical protein